MSRSTKLVVIISNLLALWLTATLVSRGLPTIVVPAVMVFALSSTAAFFLGDVVSSIVLSTIYLFPALCFAWFSDFVFSYYSIWLAGLCGAMLPRAIGSRWAYPGSFAAPLVLWALVFALSWPIVVLRELDFVPALLSPAALSASSLPQSPAIITVWVASVAAIALTGLLLLDWLFLVYSAVDPAGNTTVPLFQMFERRVIWPLLAGAVVAAAVAAYQAIVDISFLNHTFFQGLRRAVGTMRDANAFGAVEAMWLPVAAAMAAANPGRRFVAAAWSSVFLVLGVAVWASGSRTALLASVVGASVVVVHAWRLFSIRQRLLGALGSVIVCAAIASAVPSSTWTRVRSSAPAFSGEEWRAAAYQLWSRDMYGTVALQMIAEHPFVGVGVGGFNYQYGDVLYRMNGTERPPDNAQNWYRQQLAELGLLGSIGWITWLMTFVWMLVHCPDATGKRLMAGGAEGAVLGLAAASLLGMPTQDAAASISLVVLACWCMMLKEWRGLASFARTRQRARLEWAMIVVVLAGFLGGTVQAARGTLRPPLRALGTGVPYRYGFTPDTSDPTIRWTGAKAVEIITAEKRWLKVEVGDVAPDAASKPVHVNVLLNRKSVISVTRRNNFPITRWIRMPKYGTSLMMQIEVSRTWRPADFGGAVEDGERGVAVRVWTFSDADPPKGSVTFESPDEFVM